MDSLVHFEIHASEPERLAEFYRQLFGWKIDKYEGIPGLEYWGVVTAEKDAPGAINGGLMRRSGPKPTGPCATTGFVCTMLVQDIDAVIRKALELGATEAMQKYALPGMAWQAYLTDPDGNTFGLHQPDPNAK